MTSLVETSRLHLVSRQGFASDVYPRYSICIHGFNDRLAVGWRGGFSRPGPNAQSSCADASRNRFASAPEAARSHPATLASAPDLSNFGRVGVGRVSRCAGIKPLWLLKLPSTDIAAIPWTTWKLPLGIVRRLKYRSRVLDVWVKRHWEEAEAMFATLQTVEERAIHIDLPVYLDKQFVEAFSG